MSQPAGGLPEVLTLPVTLPSFLKEVPQFLHLRLSSDQHTCLLMLLRGNKTEEEKKKKLTAYLLMEKSFDFVNSYMFVSKYADSC